MSKIRGLGKCKILGFWAKPGKVPTPRLLCSHWRGISRRAFAHAVQTASRNREPNLFHGACDPCARGLIYPGLPPVQGKQAHQKEGVRNPRRDCDRGRSGCALHLLRRTAGNHRF